VELAAKDSDSYRNHLRISEAQLDFLLQKVSHLIQKADTLRPALPAKQIENHPSLSRNRNLFSYLSTLYRVQTCSISLMIPEVSKAIYDILDMYI
jgi:hypothetical protein